MPEDILITEIPFSPEEELKRFRANVDDAGAIVTFLGVVRGEDDVSELRLDHYPDFTQAQISQIVSQARNRWALIGCRVVHRVGPMVPGDEIVWVATASRHRRDAFEAADFLMDYLKSEAPFWKQEKRAGQSEWIEPRNADITDKSRWTD